MSFELTQTADGTLLRLRHSGWAAAQRPHRDGFDDGWRDKLAKDLPAALDKQEGPPGPAGTYLPSANKTSTNERGRTV